MQSTNINKNLNTISLSLPEMGQYFENQYFNTNKLRRAKRLATNTETVFHTSEKETYRTLLHQMRFVSKDFSLDREIAEKRRSRVRFCGHARTVENGTVNIVKQTNGNYSFNGVASCSNYWRCPVCAYKIVQEKQKFLFGLAKEHDKNGGKMGFVTLTIRHTRNNRLQTTIDKLIGNYRSTQQRKWFNKLSQKIQGQVKTLEITFSEENGWHPHLHLLFFYDKETKDSEILELQQELIKKWCVLETKKFGANNSLQSAQDQKICYNQNVAEYCSKWDMSYEMTKGNVKSSKSYKGLNVNTILGKLALKDYEDFKQKRLLQGLFGEYIEATYRKNFLTISPSLRKIYSEYFKEAEKTDEEVCNTAEIAEIMLKISIPVWKKISLYQLQPLLMSAFRKPFDAEEDLKNEWVESYGVNALGHASKAFMSKEEKKIAEEFYNDNVPCNDQELRLQALENVVDLLTRFKKLGNICIEVDKNNCPIIL